MNYKLFALISLFCSVAFSSCTSTDDYGIDVEWKEYNEKIVMETAAKTTEYTPLASLSGNGNVYYKYVTDFVPDEKSSPSTKVTKDGKPYSTDSVTVRYTGWYLLKDETKYTFSTTEGEYNGVPRTFQVGINIGSSMGDMDGLATMLQHMKVGEQVEVCIPQRLGHGSLSQTYIPAYTTLWFRIKLLKIIPGNKGEWE
ncbi:MAG: FKBP-type peptidyl-prolyl cis-trans isomerase [Prevotella sp.]|jgi:FKBP-type peptidyl-prolyl cis-trans isomerase|nr:FKBP-type peptidyl-prolyl cis-trans isomerase [Prevotella sp.]